MSQAVWLPRGNGPSAFGIASGARLIDSTPPATNRSPAPATTEWQAETTADKPDAHSRFNVTPGTESGRPASNAAIRATFLLSSPGLVRAAEADVLDLLRRNAGPLDGRSDRDRAEIVGTDAREPAAVAPDRRANR